MFIVLWIDQCSSRVGRAGMNLRSFSRVECPPVRPAMECLTVNGYKHDTPSGVNVEPIPAPCM